MRYVSRMHLQQREIAINNAECRCILAHVAFKRGVNLGPLIIAYRFQFKPFWWDLIGQFGT